MSLWAPGAPFSCVPDPSPDPVCLTLPFWQVSPMHPCWLPLLLGRCPAIGALFPSVLHAASPTRGGAGVFSSPLHVSSS